VTIMRRRAISVAVLAAGWLIIPAAPGAAKSSNSAQQDEAQCFGETATVVGTPGPDHLRGTPGRDVIQALGGNDVVRGLGGDDLICGDTGKDRLYGGDGDDTLHKESGGSLMVGGRGTDRMFGGLGDDVMIAGPGNDYMLGGSSDDEDFHPGKDRMFGGPGQDFADGGLGDDRIYGGRGNDNVQGGVGLFSDRVSGGPGDDSVTGSFGDDKLFGGPGADRIISAEGADTVWGGPGDDRLEDRQGNDTLAGGPGNDELIGAEDNDTLIGGPGNDQLDGGPGDDRLRGGPGDDGLDGGDGDDVLLGGPGGDRLLGRAGNDRLFGGTGDDFLNGGPGDDQLDGGPGHDTLVDDTLASLIAFGDRNDIRDWAAARTIAQIDAEVAALSPAERDRLAELVLDTNASGEARDKMLRVMRRALAVPALGFYTEVWSYTFIELVPGGFFGGCNHLFLDPSAWGGLSDQDAWNVFLHESFHSFNCVNGGPAGSLDEGSAIWITFAPFDAPLIRGQSLAETTYGTKLYYRDINGQPDYPLTAPLNPTQKLLDVYGYLSAHDPSQLPWDSNERLHACFERYFVDLNRDVDFFNVWLPAVKQRTDLMLADAECKPL
jgi:Ca2+-binding RTX toxin-like protein